MLLCSRASLLLFSATAPLFLNSGTYCRMVDLLGAFRAWKLKFFYTTTIVWLYITSLLPLSCIFQQIRFMNQQKRSCWIFQTERTLVRTLSVNAFHPVKAWRKAEIFVVEFDEPVAHCVVFRSALKPILTHLQSLFSYTPLLPQIPSTSMRPLAVLHWLPFLFSC